MALTTEQRGYGWAYRRQRAALLAAMTQGQPCPRCGQPMYRWQHLDADHYPPQALGGGPIRLTHRRCNRAAGAILGHKLRARRRATSRRW